MNSETIQELWRAQPANDSAAEAAHQLERAKLMAAEWEKDYDRADHAVLFSAVLLFMGSIPMSWIGDDGWSRLPLLLVGIGYVAVLVVTRCRRRQLERDFGISVLGSLERSRRLMGLRSLLTRASAAFTAILFAVCGIQFVSFRGFSRPDLAAAAVVVLAALVCVHGLRTLRKEREKLNDCARAAQALRDAVPESERTGD